MKDLPLFLAFLGAVSILTVTPGADTAMVLRAATIEGRRAAALTAAGIGVGCLVWGAAVALGLGAVLRASELAYTMVKLAGAAYLLWLGIALVIRPRSGLVSNSSVQPVGNGSAFHKGLATNLLNPKIGVFYVTFLPQFVPVGMSVALGTFLLAVVHVLLGLAWFGILIAATVPLAQVMRRPAVIRWLDRMTGFVLVGFGLRLAFAQR
ncbi:LysE family translocator [Novosphingobium sp.]|uniref:LysE family translocator n=1 Tax=Novosphingobium sp. TaxID=1874826 RepID=UPI0025D77F4C|nr:LysE family translocator [Novosphingobium sp.]